MLSKGRYRWFFIALGLYVFIQVVYALAPRFVKSQVPYGVTIYRIGFNYVFQAFTVLGLIALCYWLFIKFRKSKAATGRCDLLNTLTVLVIIVLFIGVFLGIAISGNRPFLYGTRIYSQTMQEEVCPDFFEFACPVGYKCTVQDSWKTRDYGFWKPKGPFLVEASVADDFDCDELKPAKSKWSKIHEPFLTSLPFAAVLSLLVTIGGALTAWRSWRR